MPAMKAINVLVYSGTGTTNESVRQCLYSLRQLLSPHFAVSTVTASALLKEPWTSSCALLVFPGGADLPYCKTFEGDGNRRISQYVKKGGAYLGFCAGGYYGSARCEFEVDDKTMAVVGSRELAFFPGTCRGAAFKGFKYGSEAGARAAKLSVKAGQASSKLKCYFNGGGVFVDAEKLEHKGVEVLASYDEDLNVEGSDGKAAIVYCKVGQGNVVLTGPHPEFAAINLNKSNGGPEYAQIIEELAQEEQNRTSFLKACLEKLGLVVPETQHSTPTLSEIYLTSEAQDGVWHLVDRLGKIITKEGDQRRIVCANDTFILEDSSVQPFSTRELAEALTPTDPLDPYAVPKHIVLYSNTLPSPSFTPYFNHSTFYTSLAHFRALCRSPPTQFGTFLLYGETVTSTNTLLEKNPSLLAHLPNGTTFTATTQVAGRGRGTNSWVAPIGSLLFSAYLIHPLSLSTRAPIIFIQYLIALAITTAVKTYTPAHAKMPLKLKWPNDIYGFDTNANSYTKIAGILINSSYSGTDFQLVVGCGVNTDNAAPTTSLNALLKQQGIEAEPYTQEKLLAKILVVFEEMYYRFCANGFSVFLKEYYENWLHTGQLVKVETEGGIQARVLGITSDFGLLEVEEVGTRKRFTLQSDGNSFDFFRGLLKRKI